MWINIFMFKHATYLFWGVQSSVITELSFRAGKRDDRLPPATEYLAQKYTLAALDFEETSTQNTKEFRNQVPDKPDFRFKTKCKGCVRDKLREKKCILMPLISWVTASWCIWGPYLCYTAGHITWMQRQKHAIGRPRVV